MLRNTRLPRQFRRLGWLPPLTLFRGRTVADGGVFKPAA